MFTGNIRKTENDSGLGFYKMAATFSEINVIFIGFLQTGKVELNVENRGGNHIRNFPGKKKKENKTKQRFARISLTCLQKQSPRGVL